MSAAAGDFPTDADLRRTVREATLPYNGSVATDAIIDALAPLIAAREAAAWDVGYMRGRYPFTQEGQDDPIPPATSPPRWGLNANPYRQEADDDHN